MIVGLTGSIASGKSTVAKFFRELGAYIIDWDVLAREVVYPNLPAWEKIVEYFGKEILNKDLTLNRQKLGEIVFNNQEILNKLNQIVHPEIFKEDKRRTEEIKKLKPDALIIKDIPLLSETSSESLVDKIVVIYTSEETQLKRMKQRGFNQEEALKRIKAQDPLSTKMEYADFIIYNDGSFEETKSQVEKICKKLK